MAETGRARRQHETGQIAAHAIRAAARIAGDRAHERHDHADHDQGAA